MSEKRLQKPTYVTTGEVRLCFPVLSEPQGFKGDPTSEKFYSAVLLFPADYDLTPIKAAMKAAVEEKWGGTKLPKASRDANPLKAFKDVANPPSGFEEGMHMLRVKTKNKPGLVDQQVNPILDPTLVYAGCYVRANINAFGWHNDKSGDGVSFGLNHIQFLRHGDRLDGRRSADQVFEPVAFDADDALATSAPASAPAVAETAPADDMFA